MLILPENCGSITSNYSIKVTVNGIKYSSKTSYEVKSLSTFFENLEKTYNKYHILGSSKKIPMEDFYWRTVGGMSGQGSLTHIASGAILGGLIAGPLGAVLGGASSDKDNDTVNEKRNLVVGSKDKEYY